MKSLIFYEGFAKDANTRRSRFLRYVTAILGEGRINIARIRDDRCRFSEIMSRDNKSLARY